MTGTTPQKIARVASDLALHPKNLTRYVQHNVRKAGSPMDLEIPWFSYAAIDYLENYVQPHMKVFEFGSGGSTIFFSKRAKSVRSIENDGAWFERVSDRLREKSIKNVEMELHPFDVKNPVSFSESTYFKALNGKEKYDVIIVDGAEEWTQVRPACFARAEENLNPGGIIIVDDSWRYQALRDRNKAQRHLVFRSTGPCRPGVTSTDVFFY